MGILEHFSTPYQRELIGKMTENANNKIPHYAREYKKEYLYIRGLNKEFKYFQNHLDELNDGLFKSKRSDRLCYLIKRFLRAQEKGKLKDISEFEIYEFEVEYLIKIKDRFRCYKLRYNACNNVDSDEDCGDVNEVVYPGFGYIFNLFEIFFNKLNIEYEDTYSYSDIELLNSDIDSDNDSDDF